MVRLFRYVLITHMLKDNLFSQQNKKVRKAMESTCPIFFPGEKRRLHKTKTFLETLFIKLISMKH